jgi:hypothetical protein
VEKLARSVDKEEKIWVKLIVSAYLVERNISSSPRDAQRVCSLKSNGHKTRPSWLSRVQEAQRAVPHATADDAVHGAFMTLPRYTYTRENACDALAHMRQEENWAMI